MAKITQATMDARKLTKLAQNPAPKQDVLLCYEVWYQDDKDNRQMVAAYWDVMVAWKVAGAINASSFGGRRGIAEVAVACGLETNAHDFSGTPRTDVLNEQGIRSNPNEQKFEAAKREFESHYNDQPEPEWKPKPWTEPSANDMRELVNPEREFDDQEHPCVTKMAGAMRNFDRSELVNPEQDVTNTEPDATDWSNSPTPPPEAVPPSNQHEWGQFEDGAWGWRFKEEAGVNATEIFEWKPECTPQEAQINYRDALPGEFANSVVRSLFCSRCQCYKTVKQILPANPRHADPTESYRLECGHVTI